MIHGTPHARRRIAIDARAKLNLTLAVGPLRPDGFHDLVTVFQSISLADTLILEPRRRGFSLVVKHEAGSLRGPDENLLQREQHDLLPEGEGDRYTRYLVRQSHGCDV